MIINFEQSPEAIKNNIKIPSKAHGSDSGFDIFCPVDLRLIPFQRMTVDLQIKFELKDLNEFIGLPFMDIKILGLQMEGQIRPKSGRSQNGVDIEIGTIDNGYRGYIGCTVSNTTRTVININKNEKICQIVFAPVFTGIGLIAEKVDINTSRSTRGFGSSGI